MEKRIGQLEKEGFSKEIATAIAEQEAKRTAELIAEGFASEKAPGRAIREVKYARLVAEKLRAGLSKAQAEEVALGQCNHDERLAATAVAVAAEVSALEAANKRIKELEAKLAAVK